MEHEVPAYPSNTGYWITTLDGFYAVISARGVEAGYEGIGTYGEALDHIRDLEHRDLIEARDERAAQDDFEAQTFAEAA